MPLVVALVAVVGVVGMVWLVKWLGVSLVVSAVLGFGPTSPPADSKPPAPAVVAVPAPAAPPSNDAATAAAIKELAGTVRQLQQMQPEKTKPASECACAPEERPIPLTTR